ncbi:MAG: hypothetical protein J2P46_06195 [Zavarzinella sp.]|nr:hypothetical protein [Zavarzinella sp.]
MRPILLLLLLVSAADAQDGPSLIRRMRLLLEKQGNKAATDQELRKELLRRRDEDQKFRQQVIEAQKKGPVPADLVKQLAETDRANREWLKGVVEKKGWPVRTLVGFDGEDAAWLMVQHADPDPAFQKQALKLLEAAVKENEARPIHVAYLTDRVQTGEGKKQIYGTQFTLKDGKLQAQPIEDEANVDKRRAELGMVPLAEYRKLMEQAYGK